MAYRYINPKLVVDAHERAQEDFANHKLEVLVEDTEKKIFAYRCYRTYEDGGFCSTFYFRVLIQPGCILVTGDIGTLVIEPRSAQENPLAWLASSYPSMDYIFEKVPQEVTQGFLEWDDDLALLAAQWYEQLALESDDESTLKWAKVANEIREHHEHRCWDSGNDFRTWLEQYDAYLWNNDPPITEQVSWSFFWKVEALVWLAKKLGYEVREPDMWLEKIYPERYKKEEKADGEGDLDLREAANV